MELEDGIVILGDGALADGQGLRELGALPREGLRDAQSASQDIAMQNKSAGVGSALVGAGHGNVLAYSVGAATNCLGCAASTPQVRGKSAMLSQKI